MRFVISQTDFDTQSVRSYVSHASTHASSQSFSPTSSNATSKSKKKQKKQSLPAEFRFTPIMNEVMDIATDQMGNANLKDVQVVKSPMPIRKKSLFKTLSKEKNQGMELQFTFNPNMLGKVSAQELLEMMNDKGMMNKMEVS